MEGKSFQQPTSFSIFRLSNLSLMCSQGGTVLAGPHQHVGTREQYPGEPQTKINYPVPPPFQNIQGDPLTKHQHLYRLG